jgi:maleylpyruvate isomerase
MSSSASAPVEGLAVRPVTATAGATYDCLSRQWRDWMDHGTRLFLDCLEGLRGADLDAASGLPGWTRRHLVAHVHHNAEALRRLVSWARTGVRTPMYVGPEQRATEIEATASWPAAELCRTVRDSALALAEDLDRLTEDEWWRRVENAQGVTIPVSDLPWMRAREVAIHTVDLRAGYSFDDLPEQFNAALVSDVATKRVSSGEAAALAAWLTGRSGPPELLPWL